MTASNGFTHDNRLARDASGFAVFSSGDIGAVHVMCHRFLDNDQPALGHRLLGSWLEGREGQGSDWLHIQFHMALFELALNRWEDAWHRFNREVLPAATGTLDALQDAPALLWRLALTAPRPVDLPWASLRTTAVRSMRAETAPYVALHNLLAFAGARDIVEIDRWLASRSRTDHGRSRAIVVQMGVALRDFAVGAYRRAAMRLVDLAPEVAKVGGSGAQNELFCDLARVARQRARIELAAA